MLRISIRDQVIVLLILVALISELIISIPIWNYVRELILGVENRSLIASASIKADQIGAELLLLRTVCQDISTRILLQQALHETQSGKRYNVMHNAQADLQIAMRSDAQPYSPLQARLYSRSPNNGHVHQFLQVTSQNIQEIELPYLAPNGSAALLGGEYGYPPALYPNITISEPPPDPLGTLEDYYGAMAFPHIDLNEDELLLGPMAINETVTLISLTMPVRSYNDYELIVGYMTLILETKSMAQVMSSGEGLGSSGVSLIVGPAQASNRFDTKAYRHDTPPSPGESSSTSTDEWNSTALPPIEHSFDLEKALFVDASAAPENDIENGTDIRGCLDAEPKSTFDLFLYPDLLEAFRESDSGDFNASASIVTTNECDMPISLGIASVRSDLVDWMVVVEKARRDVMEPIKRLKNILIGCVIGMNVFILLIVHPTAHWGVKSIRRLKYATRTSIISQETQLLLGENSHKDEEHLHSKGRFKRCLIHIVQAISRAFSKKAESTVVATCDHDPSTASRDFKVPDQVPVYHYFIKDELTELTEKFNEMALELEKQYAYLEQKVDERTYQLELSKREAEEANNSKTVFMANISHELKTPLNHIIGLCSLSGDEDDIDKIKASIKTISTSGQILARLLDDLLSFAKNQSSRRIQLDETKFTLKDIAKLILAYFRTEALDRRVSISVELIDFEKSSLTSCVVKLHHEQEDHLPALLQAMGPPGMGQLQSASLWGDQSRIMQIMTHLVSNSIKFMPGGGDVRIRIRCLGELQNAHDGDKDSEVFFLSESGSIQSEHDDHHFTVHGEGENKTSTAALEVDVMAGSTSSLSSVPPQDAIAYMFKFEVEDNGPGIPKDLQEEIFQPFVQGDLGLNKRFQGTGIGLSICAQLVESMNGTISVRSEEGEGSIFTFAVPLKFAKNDAPSIASSSTRSCPLPLEIRPAHTDTPRRSLDGLLDEIAKGTKPPGLDMLRLPIPRTTPVKLSASPPKERSKKAQMPIIHEDQASKTDHDNKARVLLEEDNAINARIAKQMLKVEGIDDVTIAKDGQEAYDIVKAAMEKELRFNLILMDVQMPVVDGLDSTRRIRELGCNFPIIALTAYTDEENVKACFEAGMNKFLGKPIKRSLLKQVVRTYIKGEDATEKDSIVK